MFKQGHAHNGKLVSRLNQMNYLSFLIFALSLFLMVLGSSAYASTKNSTGESFTISEDLALQATTLRLDRFDAFTKSIQRFEAQAKIQKLTGFLEAQTQIGSPIPTLLQRHEQQVGQPYGAWVSELLTEYPRHSFRLLAYLAEVNPYHRDEMRLALASYLSSRYGQLPTQSASSVPLPSLVPEISLGLVETEGTAVGDSANIAGGAAASVASSSSLTSIALYSVAGTFALASSSITGDSSVCKICGAGNTVMGENSEAYETNEYKAQKGLAVVNASSAYARGHNGEGALVSVVDSPFQLDHPEFSGKLVTGYNIDHASHSAAVCSDNTTTSCSRNHGTHVASTIAGSKDNGSGMHGVAYNAKIKPVAFITGSMGFTSTQLSNMFAAASGLDNGTQIVAMNNSWGPAPDVISTGVGTQVYIAPDVSDATLEPLYHTWLKAAADAGTIMVWAAGNDGWNSETGRVSIYSTAADYTAEAAPVATPLASDFVDNTTFTSANQVDYLTKLPSLVSDASSYIIDQSKDEYRWLTVVATDPTTNKIASFSNGCGPTKNYCLAAPGVSIYAAIDGSSYGNLQGTSMAAPHVSGAIAVLADMYPDLEPEEIVAIILRSATDLGTSGVDVVYGHGLLNLKKATGPLGSINLASASPSGSGVALLGGSAQIESPAIAGNALASINLALLDEYERLYEISVPVTAKLHERLTLAERMKQTGATTSEMIQIGTNGALSFQVDNPEDVNEVSVQYQQQTQNGLLRTGYDSSVHVSKTNDEVAAFSDDYSQYYLEPTLDDTMQQTAYLGLSHVDNDSGIGMSTSLRASNSDNGAVIQYSSGWSMQRGPVASKVTIGGISETNSFLGAQMDGALALGDAGTRTIFGRVDLSAALGGLGQLDLFYVAGRSDAQFIHSNLIDMHNLKHDSYGASVSKAFGEDGENQVHARIWRPLALTSGNMMINQITNYRRSGLVETTSHQYNLVPKRETAMSIEMLWGGLRAGVYHRMNALHQQGLNETGGYLTTSIKL